MSDVNSPFDGVIDAQLAGRTIERVLKDGTHLIIETSDGHSVKIAWLEGEPVHVRTDVRVIVPGAFAKAIVASM